MKLKLLKTIYLLNIATLLNNFNVSIDHIKENTKNFLGDILVNVNENVLENEIIPIITQETIESEIIRAEVELAIIETNNNAAGQRMINEATSLLEDANYFIDFFQQYPMNFFQEEVINTNQENISNNSEENINYQNSHQSSINNLFESSRSRRSSIDSIQLEEIKTKTILKEQKLPKFKKYKINKAKITISKNINIPSKLRNGKRFKPNNLETIDKKIHFNSN
jgi:hypothetical protein